MFDIDVISYVLLTVAILFIRHQMSVEIKDTCSTCLNNVNRPKRQGLYKIRFFLSALSHFGVALVVYHLIR